jgi:hypothetical protein
MITLQECDVREIKGDGVWVYVSNEGLQNAQIRILNGQFAENKGYGISVTSTFAGDAQMSQVHIENNDLESNALGGLNGAAMVASRIVGNYFESTRNTGEIPIKLGCGTHGQCFGILISSNMFNCNHAPCCVQMSGGDTSEAIVIEANSFNSAAGNAPVAVKMDYGHSDVRIANNRLYDGFTGVTVPLSTYPGLGQGIDIRHSHQGTNLIGFFGAEPCARQTGGGTAGAQYTAREQAMLNSISSALHKYGLLADATYLPGVESGAPDKVK